jgi:FKBP-type peptidyl-prolyl cis-trans isomerase FkpA
MEKRFIKIIRLYLPKSFKKYQMKSHLYLFFSIFIFLACSNNDTDFEPQTEEDIISYIEENDLNANRTNSGLYYVIDNSGSGTRPTSSSNVTVAYKGYFLNGGVFDQSDVDGISFGLNRVISGWTEGIPLFKEGGEGLLLVPSNLGYGANGRNSVPGGAVLVFDIKLISVN